MYFDGVCKEVSETCVPLMSSKSPICHSPSPFPPLVMQLMIKYSSSVYPNSYFFPVTMCWTFSGNLHFQKGSVICGDCERQWGLGLPDGGWEGMEPVRGPLQGPQLGIGLYAWYPMHGWVRLSQLSWPMVLDPIVPTEVHG